MITPEAPPSVDELEVPEPPTPDIPVVPGSDPITEHYQYLTPKQREFLEARRNLESDAAACRHVSVMSTSLRVWKTKAAFKNVYAYILRDENRAQALVQDTELVSITARCSTIIKDYLEMEYPGDRDTANFHRDRAGFALTVIREVRTRLDKQEKLKDSANKNDRDANNEVLTLTRGVTSGP
jgi:hypothetical protein